jgi:hypothetical protein
MSPRPDAAQESYRVRPRSSEGARVCRAKVDLEARVCHNQTDASYSGDYSHMLANL